MDKGFSIREPKAFPDTTQKGYTKNTKKIKLLHLFPLKRN